MARDMKDFVNEGKEKVKDQMKVGREQIQDIGLEVKDVKEGLSDMPEGLDSDIAEMIKEAKQEATDMGGTDISNVENSIIRKAQSDFENIKSSVTDKIADNKNARRKLDGINSKYGKSSIERGKSALDNSSKMGNDLINEMQDVIKDSIVDISKVKDNL